NEPIQDQKSQRAPIRDHRRGQSNIGTASTNPELLQMRRGFPEMRRGFPEGLRSGTVGSTIPHIGYVSEFAQKSRNSGALRNEVASLRTLAASPSGAPPAPPGGHRWDLFASQGSSDSQVPDASVPLPPFSCQGLRSLGAAR